MSEYKTRQELFNNAWNGLKSQGFKRCVEEYLESTSCRYYGPDNTHCAIGWNIPVEKYNRLFEGYRVNEHNIGEAAGVRLEDIAFASNLQKCHDHSYEPEAMEERLRQFARKNGLSIPE